MTSRDRGVLEAVRETAGDFEEIRTRYRVRTGREIAPISVIAALVRLRRASLVEILPRNRQRPTYRATT